MGEAKKRHILFVAPDPGAGGSTKALLPVLKHLHDNGYTLLVMMPSEGYFSTTLDSMGIKYEINPYINLCLWPEVNNLVDVLKFIPRLIKWRLILQKGYKIILKAVANFAPDLIYSNSSIILAGYLAAKKCNIKHIWHVHEYGDKDFGRKNFPSNRIKRKRLASTASISITKEIHDFYKLNGKGVIIYNGIKSSNYIPEKDNTLVVLEKFVLYAGHITENKGVTDLIDAFIQYRNNNGSLNLILCGRIESPYKETLLNIIAIENAENSITFAGQVNNIDSYMSNAEAIIVPSKYEAFGLVTTEAMFNNCLIIGRDTGGTKEQFDLGLNQTSREIGLRFKTTEELTKCLHEVEHMNKRKRERYTLHAHNTAVYNFTLENYTDKVQKYIESTLNIIT